jgi:hypothetical protein
MIAMRRNAKVVFASTLLAASLHMAVHAQSSGGNITGEASSGDTVTITGVDTGFKRELKIEKDGKYQIRRVPTGEYQVVRVHKDGTIDPVQSITVRVGSTARVMEPGQTDTKAATSDS